MPPILEGIKQGSKCMAILRFFPYLLCMKFGLVSYFMTFGRFFAGFNPECELICLNPNEF